MNLHEIDEAIRLTLPLQFTLDDAFRAIGGQGSPTRQQQHALGGALRARGYVKARIMRNGVQAMRWCVSEPALADSVEAARVAWERAAEVELAARQRYHDLKRAVR